MTYTVHLQDISDNVPETQGQGSLSDDHSPQEIGLADSTEPDRFATLEHKQRTPETLQVRRSRAGHQQTFLSSSGRELQLAPGTSSKIKRTERTHPHGESLITGDLTEIPESSGKSNDQLRLRLDLNLDIEVQLKARIEGDITLSLL